jgi:hypothetical protein
MTAIALQELPDGYIAIPLVDGGADGALRIAVVVKREGEPIAGQFVTVDTLTDGRMVLGCLIDAGGRVHRWLEVAIQDVERAAASLTAARGMMTNRLLDERWERQTEAENAPPFGPILSCGWEHRHARPILLDVASGRAVSPRDPGTGDWFDVCTNDGALARAGLPSYNSTLHRYLWVESQGDASTFIALTGDAPQNERCKTLTDVMEGYLQLLRLNAKGGLMRVREYQPVRFEAFLDLLSGVPWNGIRHGRIELDLGEKLDLMYAMTDDPSLGDGWLFQGVHGKWGRLIETLHLKMRAFADAVSVVHDAVRARCGSPARRCSTSTRIASAASSVRSGMGCRSSGRQTRGWRRRARRWPCPSGAATRSTSCGPASRARRSISPSRPPSRREAAARCGSAKSWPSPMKSRF